MSVCNDCGVVISHGNKAASASNDYDRSVQAFLGRWSVDHDILRNGRRHGLAYLNPVPYAGNLPIFRQGPAIRTDEQARAVFDWMAEQDYFLQIVGGDASAGWRMKGGALTRVDPTQQLILDLSSRYIVSPGTLAKEGRYCVLELGDAEKGGHERIEPRQLGGG
jgi:hypothetical protein